VGYLSYECCRYLENIPAFQKPRTEPDALLFIFQNYLIYDHQLKRLKVISLNFDSLPVEEKLKQSQALLKKALEVRTKNQSDSPSDSGKTGASQKNSVVQSKDDTASAVLGLKDRHEVEKRFSQKISKIKKHIRDGDIFQCVLSESFQVHTEAKPLQIMQSIRKNSRTPYTYFLDAGEFCLMGASPEMLVRVRGPKVQTCPIAGTRQRGATEKEDQRLAAQLFASVKEKAEHAMLVDLSRNDIGRISNSKSVRVQQFMQLKKFSNVMHLTSLVEGELKNSLSAWDALFSCFPAGTLSGAPKIRAMEIISELEDQGRGFYGGAIVAADFAGSLDSCIAIRSLLYRDGEVRFQAGAGVVADSKASREFQEILDKTKALRAALLDADPSLKNQGKKS
ncbi:MAG: anthranilate synthase component I family protein, partial [Pseudobdellovibrionaceae bacterium]